MDQLSAAILRGQLGAGEQLPSIRMLAKELEISVITSKRAYEELGKSGLVYTVPGRGSFVAGHERSALAASKHRLIGEKLQEAVDVAERLGVNKQELKSMLEKLLGG